MAIEAYPLTWPQGWKRIPAAARKNAQFGKTESGTSAGFNNSSYSWKRKKDLSVTDGLTRILDSLGRMGVDRQDVIISTNVRTRLDGLPRSRERAPDDPGAAVYWQERAGVPMRCMAIDRYTTVADNLAAIGATLEAMRAIERHGGAEILDRAFTGFKALAAENAGESWWKTLQLSPDADEEQITAAYRSLARLAHPDAPGGSHAAMSALNAARDQALSVVRGKAGD